MFDEELVGEVSLQVMRKSLRKNKLLMGISNGTPELEALLTPRFFHGASQFLSISTSDMLDFDLFVTFCDVCERKKIIDRRAVSIFKSISKAKLDDLPYIMYTTDGVMKELLLEESRSFSESEGYASKLYPLGVLLKPLLFRQALESVLSERDSKKGDILEELDFVLMCDRAVEMYIKNPNYENQIVCPKAETFHEMSQEFLQAGLVEKAAFYLEQSVSLRPNDKVYRVALSHVNILLEKFSSAIKEAETSMEVSERFWPPALQVLIRAYSLQLPTTVRAATEIDSDEKNITLY